jgi:hypothetical protein
MGQDTQNQRLTAYKGLTFAHLREFLFNLYFYYNGMPRAQADEMLRYVVPMQHNIDNPLGAGADSKDTYIQFWIMRDEKWTMDVNGVGSGTGQNQVGIKVADIMLRFVGREAEVWAKAFHHLNQRKSAQLLMMYLCDGAIFDYVGAITPVNVDYFGVGNSSTAFDLTFKIRYKETIELDWEPLELILLGPGDITVAGEALEDAE